MLRVDLVERLATHAHEARTGKQEEAVDEALRPRSGFSPEAVARLMRDLGFRPAESEAKLGLARPRPAEARRPGRPYSPAFAALAE